MTVRGIDVDIPDIHGYAAKRDESGRTFEQSCWRGRVPARHHDLVIPDLVHELALRFFSLRAVVRQLKYTIAEVHDESFGLKSVFGRAMDHRSCQCHTQPTVVEELFREVRTTPVWDVAYSSAEPLVRAAEYKVDIAGLFSGLASVSSSISVFLEETGLRIDMLFNDLLRAERASKLGELNFHLAATQEGADEFMTMLNHLEIWLRK